MTPCSIDARAEPLAGTAPHTRGWLIVEHPGPYPRVASEALGVLGDQLRAACQQKDLTLVLARRPRTQGRRAWLAVGGAVAVWHDIEAEDLLELPHTELDTSDAVATTADPVLFVCTNGKRDACCAQFGRPVAQALLAEGLPVWECSHLGGHRFAPTALLLPHGAVHGRLTIESARALLASDHVDDALQSLRGMSHLPADHQVADIAVRRTHEIPTSTRLEVESTDDGPDRRTCTVRHPDGRTWQVHLARRSGDARAESCAKEPAVPQWWTVAAPIA